MKKENEAVLTDDNVIYLEEIDYIDEISEDEKALNDLISAVVRKNLEKDFDKPELLNDQKFIQGVKNEVRRKLKFDAGKGNFEKNKDRLTEVANSITYNVLRCRYNLKPSENHKEVKLNKVNVVFDKSNLRTPTVHASNGVKTASLPADIRRFIY